MRVGYEQADWRCCWYWQLRKCTEKIKLFQDFSDFAEEKDWFSAFINPFLLSKQQNMKMPITYKVEIIHFKTFSIVKTYRYSNLQDFPSVQSLGFLMWFISGDPYHVKISQNYENALRVIFRFEITFKGEKAFSSMRLIKSKTKSRLTDSNL